MRTDDIVTILITAAILATGWALYLIFNHTTKEEEILRTIQEHRSRVREEERKRQPPRKP